MNPRRAFIAVGIVTLLVLSLAYAAYVHNPEVEGYRVPFDTARWRSRALDQDPGWPTRLRMADDLISSRALDGLRHEDVERLLGPGDETDKWRDWDLVYYLGPERSGMRLDAEWLVIRFDQSGRVASYRLIAD